MSIPISEGFLFTNPVPSQQWSRKLVSGITYSDWVSTAEVDTFFATTTGLSPTYKYNKYFWIAGSYYFHNGTAYVPVAPAAPTGNLQSLNYTVTADSMTVTIPALEGKALVMLIMVSQIYDNEQMPLDSVTGVINGSYAGGFYNGNYLTILFK